MLTEDTGLPFLTVDTTMSRKLEVPQWQSRQEGHYSAKLPENNGWRALSVDIQFSATQTYAPSVLFPVKLDIIWGIGRVFFSGGIAQYQFDVSQQKTFTWNLPGQDEMSVYDILDIPPEFEGHGRYLIIQLRYRLPTGSLTTDSVSFTSRLGALVFNPVDATPPQWDQFYIDENPGGFPWMDYVPWVVGGALVIGGLAALGFASEKTGINVGAIKELAKGLSGAGKGLSGALGNL